MPSYILKGFEMISLMALAGFRPENHSPAWKAVNNIKIPEPDSHGSPLKGLLEAGIVGAGENGRLRPSMDATMLMKILCSPSRVTGIRRMGLSGNTEYSLLKLGNLYCLYLAIQDKDLHICQFPFDEQLVQTWFEADILVQLPPETAEKSSTSYQVDSVGCVLLNCIQDWYAKKAEIKVPIEENDMWFTGEDLNQTFDESDLSKKLEVIYTAEKIQGFLQDLRSVDTRMRRLRMMVEAGLLQSRYMQGMEYFSYSAFMMEFMDPLKLRDILFIEKCFPDHKISVVYLKDDGIFSMSSEEASVTFRKITMDDLKKKIV